MPLYCPAEVPMNICIPILENRGLLSPVSPHFAAAPMFLLVDTATLAYRSVPNPAPAEGRRCERHGAIGQPFESAIVGGIGAHALAELRRREVPVYRAPRGNVADALASWLAGKLPVIAEGSAGPGCPGAPAKGPAGAP